MAKRGPNTPAGKAASSMNALKHGLRSDAPVIPLFEDFDDWERHRAGIMAAIEPEGTLETAHAERIAKLIWRLDRVPRWETAMMTHSLDAVGEDLSLGFSYGAAMGVIRTDEEKMDKIIRLSDRRQLPSAEDMEKIMRYEGHLHRQLHQTLHELEALQARRKGGRQSPLARFDVMQSPASGL
jgi:hypothetical protein